MLSKKEHILETIKKLREFKFCGPSDDPDEQTAVCVGYHYGVTQLKRMATPFIPESIGKSLNSVEVEMNNLFSVYEARAEIDALLPDIESIIQGLDVSVFDAVGGEELKKGNMGFYDEEIAKAKTPLELRKAIEQELAAWYDVDMGGLHIMSDTLGTAIAIALSIRAKHINLPDVPSDINGLINWCITCEKIMAEVGNKEMTEEKRKFLEEHRDFLRKIAMSVSSLVSTSDERAYFRKQVEAFSHKVEEHQKELDEIKKDYEANSKLQEAAKKLDEQIKNDPVDEEGISDIEMKLHCTGGWRMLENFKDYIYYAGGFWGPSAQTVDLVTFLITGPSILGYTLPKMPNDAEKLICSFTLLSAIHDKYVKEKPIFFDKPVGFYQSQNPQHWVMKVEQRCDCFNAIFGGYFGSAKDTQAWIQRAFNDVKADLGQDKIDKNKEHATEKGREIYIENLNASQVSLGDNAQHAERDINTIISEPEKKGGRGLLIKVSIILGIIAAVVTILTFLFGDRVWIRLNSELKNNNMDVPQIKRPKTEAKISSGSSSELQLNQANIEICFKLTDTNEIAILGPGSNGSDKFTVDLIYKNIGGKTANDATLKIMYPSKLSIKGSDKQLKSYPIRSGDTLKNVTEIDIGKIRPDPIGRPIESAPLISLANITIDFLDITALDPPFSHKIYRDSLTLFEIEAQIIADDYISKIQKLYIKTGTLEAFKDYKGTIFEVKEGRLAEYKRK